VELTVGENVLRVQSVEIAPVEVLRPDVTSIVELRGEGLVLHTFDSMSPVLVSEQLEGFDHLRAHLSTWRQFDPPQRARAIGAEIITSVVLLGSWAATGLVRDIALAMAAGVVLIVTATLLIRRTLAAKTISNNYKASALVVLGMFMLAPVVRCVLYFVLQAPGGAPS
jgi:hypothetical protein